ncbi:diacylglycerol kinase family protein [Piscibacillus salipiscarius]|uniref:diacylglycerol kinase family protein n=1 Tax=Piscibacillus salipiscarius TaxID=299480 RepID=UPI0036722591
MRGIYKAIELEFNMKIHIVSMLVVIFTGIWLKIEPIEWLFIILAIAVVLIAETLNTAIENITDVLFKERDEQARNIKDISSGAVLLASIFAAIVGVIIFVPKVITFF